jgi:nicotinate-nucleotide pyrophosphorylase
MHQVEWLSADGQHVEPGKHFGIVRGPASSILVAERVALNFIQVTQLH